MEFVEGETLENLAKRLCPIEVKLALEIVTQVAAGLTAIHKEELVHRDIKPSNIMVSLDKGNAVTAKIIDLGLAKAVNESGSQAAISTHGSFAGTPEFASPEQFAGSRRRHPLGPVLSWCGALGDGDRPGNVQWFTS
jgi:eukaryotic-like serine/threonine-protein kinase